MEDFACLYVIEIGRGRIKVGYTVSPTSRLREHRGMAIAHGHQAGREWVSPRGSGTDERERALINFCAERATKRLRSEYFVGVRFDDAVRYGADLCGDVAVRASYHPRRKLADALREQGDNPPRLACRVAEAATWLGIPVEDIRGGITSGALRTVRIGPVRRGVVRIPVDSLTAFANSL